MLQLKRNSDAPAMERCEAPAVISINNSITDIISSMINGDTVIKVESTGSTWWNKFVSEGDVLNKLRSAIDIIDLSSSSSVTLPTEISTKKKTRRSTIEINRLRIETKRKREESTNRYNIALKEASKQWPSSLESQRA